MAQAISDPVNRREELRAFYVHLGEQERHFNTIQSHLRLLASTWMLASVGAAGFLLSKPLTLPVPVELLCAGFGFAGALSVLLIWLLDAVVYQGLLSENYE